MGLIADEQSAMAHVLKTAGKARTLGGPRVGRKKTGPLKRILRGRFHAGRRENGAKPGIFGCRGRFYPGGVGGLPRGPSPGNDGGVGGRAFDNSWPLRL